MNTVTIHIEKQIVHFWIPNDEEPREWGVLKTDRGEFILHRNKKNSYDATPLSVDKPGPNYNAAQRNGHSVSVAPQQVHLIPQKGTRWGQASLAGHIVNIQDDRP